MANPNGTNFVDSPEPIYGNVFLPRKFKIAITVPGDNSVDLFTNDLGLVVITDPATGELQGFNMLVGGGMGRSHRSGLWTCNTRMHAPPATHGQGALMLVTCLHMTSACLWLANYPCPVHASASPGIAQ